MARKHFLRRPINIYVGGRIHHFEAGLHANVPDEIAKHPYFKKMEDKTQLHVKATAEVEPAMKTAEPVKASCAIGVDLHSGA